MKIILYAIGLDHPVAITMNAALTDAGISFEETTDRPVGAISAQPCVCALYDNGLVASFWSDIPLNTDAITTASNADGTPPDTEEPQSVQEPTKADLLEKIEELLTAVQALQE